MSSICAIDKCMNGPENPWDWYIFAYIYHQNQQNIGRYSIHGSYGDIYIYIIYV